MIRRKYNWATLLDQATKEKLAAPFSWGGHDCCLVTCDIVKAMTGVDLADGIRGKYAGVLEAHKVLASMGGVEAIADGVAAEHNMMEWEDPQRAGRGDVVFFHDDQRVDRPEALGWVGLNGKVWATAEGGGLVQRERGCIERAWKVG